MLSASIAEMFVVVYIYTYLQEHLDMGTSPPTLLPSEGIALHEFVSLKTNPLSRTKLPNQSLPAAPGQTAILIFDDAPLISLDIFMNLSRD